MQNKCIYFNTAWSSCIKKKKDSEFSTYLLHKGKSLFHLF